MIGIKDFDSNILKIDKNSYRNIDIYYIGYITIKSISNHNNINSVNPLYFTIGEADGYIEENNGNKYSLFLLQTKTKKYQQQNIKNFRMRLKV